MNKTPTDDIETLKLLLQEALTRWKNLRNEDPQFWGEDHDPSTIEGWSKYLDITCKIILIRAQISEDLKVHTEFEDWENR
jgi:hypothetical protein